MELHKVKGFAMITRRTILIGAVVFSFCAASVWSSPYWCPDLSGDDFVDFADFAVFAGNWMQSGDGLAGDFDDSGTVDMNDLDYFVDYWLTDTDCPEYYPDQFPYMTSFEKYQGFTAGDDPNSRDSLDYQQGWKVSAGSAVIDYWWSYVSELDDYFYYQYVVIDYNTVVEKDFTGTNNDDYIRLNFIPAIDQKVNILNGPDVVASVWFNGNGYIYVLDNGSYVNNTNVSYVSVYNQCWYYFWDYIYYGYAHEYENTWTSLMFKMNWSSNTYEVYWNGDYITDIADEANFDSDYDVLTDVNSETGNDWFVLNSISISSESGSGGVINDDIYITKPCACETDEVTGRVAVTGKLWWDSLGVYEIRYCATDPAINPYDVNNWHIADVGWNVVDAGGLLGYWDTSRIPNGYYYLGFMAYNDLGYSENGLQVLETELRYPDNTLAYSGWKHFAVTSTLKCNTFYHEEEPDISVPWQGQFPFELRRI